MRIVFAGRFSLAVTVALVLSAALAACSSGGTTPAAADAGDGSNKALGQACNPSLAHPCEPLTDVCSVSECDPGALRCIRVQVEAGPTCSGGSPPEAGAPPEDAAMEAGDAGPGDAAASDAASDGAGDGGRDASIDGSADTGAADARVD